MVNIHENMDAFRYKCWWKTGRKCEYVDIVKIRTTLWIKVTVILIFRLRN